MASHPHLPVGVPYARNLHLRRLVWLYVLIWTLAAIAPADRQTWFLENLLVVAAAALLFATHRRFCFSDLSNHLLFWFFVLHAIGSHYTYSAVPLGEWARDAFGLARNHYDRTVHFAFGALLAYPIREVVLRVLHVHRAWSYLAPIAAVLALGALYEIVEAWAAMLVDPELGHAFVGAQGDLWDGQKDMGLAFLGATIAMGITAFVRRRRHREPYLG